MGHGSTKWFIWVNGSTWVVSTWVGSIITHFDTPKPALPIFPDSSHNRFQSIFDRWTSILLDFSGDQIVAYLLISAASSAIPLTNRFREGQDNIFTDSAASAITMAVLAFLSLALSALFSGYKLSTTHSFV
ncbi:CASP-like protein 4B1 [Brassica napus]|uniref:CASP-like protein 4B1 n=1 Tax=Brassica oleracea var. oleracea TaxID=109376 RepID=UPI0006A6B291|nr:PREDICTED: CASP-like protein 4B1 [Brassica oleracea var. oleracea]XP_013704557.1 CASP-like protein 4B1 [Brassica napus]